MGLSQATMVAVDAYRGSFVQAKPFKHISIEEFFAPGLAERLLEEFPSFDKRRAINEGGKVGGKSVHTAIGEISPAYEELYGLISSAPFLEFMSRLSGIPDLILDPEMYGGGTHENLHAQDLDPHIDFNYDESKKLHRRLNLIVYLNKEWNTEWGGAIEIHSNPRQPDENQITAFEPLFNRAVIFETNEISWHGFPKIQLPEEKRHLSRKSISIYLYTKDRPPDEIAPAHSTFYVQRPLPKKFREGYALTAEDVLEVRRLMIRRDQWIELYQRMELDWNRRIDELTAYKQHLESSVRLPLSGYITQEGCASGFYADGWATRCFEAQLRSSVQVGDLTLRGYRPAEAGTGRVRILVDGTEAGSLDNAGGTFEVTAKMPRGGLETFKLQVLFETASPWKPAGDMRALAFRLLELRAGHSALAIWRHRRPASTAAG